VVPTERVTVVIQAIVGECYKGTRYGDGGEVCGVAWAVVLSARHVPGWKLGSLRAVSGFVFQQALDCEKRIMLWQPADTRVIAIGNF
jgi:hypothetical protein